LLGIAGSANRWYESMHETSATLLAKLACADIEVSCTHSCHNNKQNQKEQMLPQIVSTDTKKTHVNRRVCKERAAHLDALDDTTALGSGLRLHAVEGGSHVVENLLDLGDGEFHWWYERNHLWERHEVCE
jgi:hypothetical protein